MRTKEEHIKADQLLLGYSVEWVHPYMDMAVKQLGAGHRIVKHGLNVLDWIEKGAEILGDEERAKKARKVGLLHILLDSYIIDKNWVEERI